MEFTIYKMVPLYPTTAFQARDAGVIILVLRDFYKVPKFRRWLPILNNNYKAFLPLHQNCTGLG